MCRQPTSFMDTEGCSFTHADSGVRRLAAALWPRLAAAAGSKLPTAKRRQGAALPSMLVCSFTQSALFVLAEEAGLERVPCQLPHLILGQSERSMDGQEVVHHVAAEVRRVIRVDRHSNPAAQQLAEVVLL